MRAYLDVNIDSSRHYATRYVDMCERLSFQKELIYAYQFIGHVYQVRGDHHQSIHFHYKALRLAQELHQYTRIARSYSALGHAYASLKEYDQAKELCFQGQDVLRQYPDTIISLSILNALGATYRGLNKPDSALLVNLEMYRLAQSNQQLAQSERIKWHKAEALHAIGWDYMNLGDLQKPLGYYKDALSIAREIESPDLEASILLHIAELYRLLGNWTQAIEYCNEAKERAKPHKNTSIVSEADEKLYRIFKQTGNWANALTAYEQHVVLRDSLAKGEAEQRIEAEKNKYDSEKKEAQYKHTQTLLLSVAGVILVIASLLVGNVRRLQAKNRKINQQRALLETARRDLAEANATLETRVQERTEALVTANIILTQKNEEIKAALFKGQTIERKRVALELHDNLSSLLSAVNMSMQSINPQHLSESEQSIYRTLKQLIQNAYAEVRNISHNIMPAELEKDGLVPTLTALANRLNQTTQLHFTLTVKGLTLRLPVEIEFNVYSIVLELINNVIKHAQATSVGITLVRTTDDIQLTVADDGVGLEQQSTKRGVGLQNIQARLDSLGGTLNSPFSNKGTRIDIKIPIETAYIDGERT